MKLLHPIAILLLLLAAACGDGGRDGGAAAPAPTLDQVPIDTESVRLAEWELYPVSRSRYPYAWGRVVDPEGNPVAGASATRLIGSLAATLAPLRGESVSTNEEGVFRFEEFPADSMVFVEMAGWGGRLVMVADLLPTLEEPRDFKLRPCGSVHGAVLLSGGPPVADAPVLLSTPSRDWVADTKTDAEGVYRVVDVPAGEIIVSAVPGRFRGTPSMGSVSAGEDSRMDLDLVETPAVTGRVLDKATGKPLRTAVVWTMFQREEVFPVDRDGSFRMEGASGHAMFAVADGYGEFGVGLDPARTGEDHVEIHMEPGGRVHGRVVNERAEPMGGVRLEALVNPEQRGARIRGPLTGPDGSFAFTWIRLPLEGATVCLLAKAEGGHFGYENVGYLGRGEVRDGVEVVFTRPASVRFRAVDDEGAPWPLAWVQMEKDGTGVPGFIMDALDPTSSGISDGDGQVRVNGLYGGTHKLVVIPKGRIPLETVVDVDPGNDITLPDIVLPRGLAISGRIESIGGDIHDIHEYFLTAQDVNWRTVLPIDGNGAFTLVGLDEGEYILRARLKDHEPVTMKVRGGQSDIRVRLRALSFLTVKVNHPEAGRISARVELVRMGPTHQLGKPWEKQLLSTEDEIEYFQVPPGRCIIRLNANSWVAMKEVQLEPGDRTAITLDPKPAASVSGTVLRPDGQPAIGVGVECDAGKIWGVTGMNTEDQGSFQFSGLPEGRATLRCHPFGYPPAVAELDLAAGAASKVKLQLTVGARLEVDVMDETERPFAKVKVVLARMDGQDARFWLEGSETGVTGPTGRLVFVGVQPGRHMMRLYVAGEDEPRERRTIDLADGGTEKLRFRFDR